MDTYYTILDCTQAATFEEIKRNYQRLIKVTHPDKSEQSSSAEFVKINEAWQTLKDDKLRKQYDASILQENLNDRPLIYAEVKLKELNFENGVSFYTCRCGNNILVNLGEIVTEESIFECDECSNSIVVKK